MRWHTIVQQICKQGQKNIPVLLLNYPACITEKKQVFIPASGLCFVFYFSYSLNQKLIKMKIRIKQGMAAMIAYALASLFFLNSCTEDKKCFEGYTGDLTDTSAKLLVKKCHFISQEQIEQWTGTYKKYFGNEGQGDSVTAALAQRVSEGLLRNGSVSFNSCILRKILSDKNCIGLRVLYGIDENNIKHIILVGIKPDYSNLYVMGDECCAPEAAAAGTAKAAAPAGGSTGTETGNKPGGAEFGQMP
jgi:hypothetical protein